MDYYYKENKKSIRKLNKKLKRMEKKANDMNYSLNSCRIIRDLFHFQILVTRKRD